MSKCQLFKCQKSQIHVHVYTLQYYPLFTPIQHLTASFIRFLTPFQPLTACTLSLYHTLLSDPYPFQHCIVPSLPFYSTSSLIPNHYATPHRPLLIIFNTLMFSVQHLAAFLNLLKHPTPPPFFTPFQHITVLSLPLYKTSSPNLYPFTAPHRRFLANIQHLLPVWKPDSPLLIPLQHTRSLPLYDTHSLPLYNTSFPILYLQYNTSPPVPYPFQLHQVCHGQLDSGQRTSFEGHYLPVVFSCPCKVQIDCSSAAAVVIQGKCTPAELTKF